MTDEVTIPAGMKPWAGGDCPPDDWTYGDPVLLRKGWTVPEPARWNHSPADTHPHDYDIIAYTPMTPEPAQPAEIPEARAISEHPCHGWFPLAGDRLTHRQWVQDGKLMPTCERCGTPIDREHNEVGPVSWEPDRAATTARPTERGAVEARFWLIVHEPGNVPERKGSWPATETAEVLREFIAARPTAYLHVLTVDADGTPNVEHGPEVLQMLDGRSMSVGRKHNARTLNAHSAALTPPVTVAATDQAGEVERLRTDIRNIQRNTAIYRQEAREEADKANKRAAEAEKRADNMAEANRKLLAMIEAGPAALATQTATWQQPELPMDVRRLVVAARRALDANDWASTGKRDRMRTLDKAVEAFSSRVDYDDQPTTGRTDQVADAGKPIATGRTMGGEVEAADIAEIHEIVTAWRSSIGNPATWLPRLRATLQNRGE